MQDIDLAEGGERETTSMQLFSSCCSSSIPNRHVRLVALKEQGWCVRELHWRVRYPAHHGDIILQRTLVSVPIRNAAKNSENFLRLRGMQKCKTFQVSHRHRLAAHHSWNTIDCSLNTACLLLEKRAECLFAVLTQSSATRSLASPARRLESPSLHCTVD